MEVQALVGSAEVQAHGPFGHAVANVGTVVLGELAVTVHVHEADVAGDSVGQDFLAVLVHVGVNLGLVLEDTVGLVTVEVRERHAVFRTGHGAGTLEGIQVHEAAVVTQVHQLVVQVGGVAADVEVQVLGRGELVGSLHFHTLVAHETGVAPRAGFTHIGGHRNLDEHAVGALVVVVESEGEGVGEEAQIHTHIGLDRTLPTEGRVGQAGGLHTDDGGLVAVEDVVVVIGGEGCVTEGLEGIGTVHTPGETHLGIGQPAGHVDIRLVVDVPAQGEGREITPLVVGAELGGTVLADGELHHVALAVVVVGTAKVRGQAVRAVEPAVGVLLVRVVVVVGGIADVRLVEPLRSQVAAIAPKAVAGVLEGALANHHGEGVLADFLIIGKVVFHLPYQAFLVLRVYFRSGGVVVTGQIISRSITIVAPEAHVHGERGVEMQVVPNLDVSGETAHELVAPVVIRRTGKVRDGVVHLIVSAAGNHVITAVGSLQQRFAGIDGAVVGHVFLTGIHAQDRRKGQGGTQRRTPLRVFGNALGADLGVRQLVLQDNAVQEVALALLVHQGETGIGAEGETIVVGTAPVAAHDTLLVGITQGQVVVHPVGSATHGHLVGLLRGVAVEHFLLPVGAHAIAERVGVLGSHTRVDESFIDHEGILGSVQHFALFPRIGNAEGEVVVHMGTALGALLGGYQHHAVGGAGTVNSTGRGILKHLDGLDIAGIQVVDTTGDGHAVHNVNRVGGVDGTHTTDADAGAGARLTGSGSNGNTGGEALKGIVHARRGRYAQRFGVHLGNSCGNHRFFLYTVADDHGLFQHLGVVRKDDREVLLAVVGNHLRCISDAGNLNGCTLRGGERERAVHVRHGTVIGSLLDNKRSDNGFAGGVLHLTLQGKILRHGRQSQSCKEDQSCDFFHTLG